MDYTKFLNRTEHVVLAYLGGPFAYGKDRRYRVAGTRPSPGFHRFEVRGRDARAVEAVEAPDMSGLPKSRGHHVAGWLVASEPRRLELLPAEELPPLSVVRARVWHSGDLVFESQDFDGEVEEAARLRLERLEPLGEMKAVAASLRVAFGIALMRAVARRVEVAVSIREAAAVAPRVSDGGEAVARAALADLERRRAEAERTARLVETQQDRAARIAAVQRGRRRATIEPTASNAVERAEAALDAADARMLSARRLDDGNLEVAFEFMGERFISVVEAISLHVYDAGVCLAGADEHLTLESLPSVIKEAIETGQLVITRR